MATKYESGRSFEYTVKKKFEKAGYKVYRSAGSHGHADLLAFKKVLKGGTLLLGNLEYETLVDVLKTYFIQCKNNGIISAKEREGFIEECNMLGVTPLLAHKNKSRRTVIEYADTKERFEL